MYLLRLYNFQPIVISHSKITSPVIDKHVKKRSSNELEKNEIDNAEKRCRPTLLNINREKKISKYEKYSEDCEEEEEDEEAEEEGEEEMSEMEGEEEDVPAEGEDDTVEEEDTVVDVAERNNISVDKKDDEQAEGEEEVGEEIEEEIMVIQCDGSGKECESGYINLIKLGCEESEKVVGETIEEDVFLVVGEGSGADCLVGNSKGDIKEDLCESSCLKINSTKSEKDTISKINEKLCSNSPPKSELLENNENGMVNGENLDDEKSRKVNEDPENQSDFTDAIMKGHKTKNPDLKSEIQQIEIIEQNVDANCSPSNLLVLKAKEKEEETLDVMKCEESKTEIQQPKDECSKATIVIKPEENDVKSDLKRKRRLSEEKVGHKSESEVDENSTAAEVLTEEEDVDVGRKRPKMKCKIANSNIRKIIEAERNNVNKEGSSSDEESPRKKPFTPKKYEQTAKTCSEANEHKGNNLEKVEGKALKLESQENCGDSNNHEGSEIQENEQVEQVNVNEIGHEPKSGEEIVMQIKTRSGRKITLDSIRPVAKKRGRGSNSNVQRNTPKSRMIKMEKSKIEEMDDSIEILEKSVKLDLNHDSSDDINGISSNEKVTSPIDVDKNSFETEKRVADINSVFPDGDKTSVSSKVQTKDADNISVVGTSSNEVKKEPIKRKQRRKREIDISNIIEPEAETAPVRQSRRIAQLKIKEEAERRKLEEIALKKMKQELKKKKREEKKSTKNVINEPSESSDKNESIDSEVEMRKKLEKKKRGVKKSGWTSGSDDEDDDDEDQYETDVGSPLFKSDHEFSPESDIEDESQIVPMKRARTARREGEECGEGVVRSDEACQKCGKTDHPEWILLCDKCDKGYHCSCLSPVLFIIPEGDWFCPPCQQEHLIEALEIQLKTFDELLIKKKEEEERREFESAELAQKQLEAKPEEENIDKREKQTLRRKGPRGRKGALTNFNLTNEQSKDSSDKEASKSSGYSVSTETSSSSSSSSGSSSRSSATDSDGEPIYKLRKRRQINVSYRFHEYDDLINSAIKREMDEVAGAGNLGRGKDISTIIEADKEEKLRQKQLEAQKEQELIQVNTTLTTEFKEGTEMKDEDMVPCREDKIREDSGSEFEPLKTKPKLSSRRNIKKKKNRKLNSLDISSDDDGSDEDFKTSSYETEEEDDESISVSTESDSSLEEFKRKNRKDRKNKRSSRRGGRQRRKKYAVDDFIVPDTDESEDFPKSKKKRKDDSDYSDSESEDELSEDLDSDDICDDTTDSDESDKAWRPGKRKKQNKPIIKKQQKKKNITKQKRVKRNDELSYKAGISKKNRRYDDDENSMDSGRRTRGKRFTYLEDYDDESSDDGIKPGVKRPDTPPEEREKFIRRQEEIKRMLAEKNTEAAKVAATPTLAPISRSKQEDSTDASASLSTVPLSVIRGAKALDIDYLQRRGELDSDDGDTDFDDDLPDDFNPEDMDEEEIAKMMEEEDFAQQQLKLAGEVIRQKKLKDNESCNKPELDLVRIPRPNLPLQDVPRKNLPIPLMGSPG